jgi:replicative DNA helicase
MKKCCDLDAERAVLASVLLEPEAINEAIGLDPQAFFDNKHKAIFEAMSLLHERGEAIDLLTLSDSLKTTGRLESVGGVDNLMAISSSIGSATNLEEWCNILRVMLCRRDTVKACNSAMIKAQELHSPILETCSDIEKTIHDAAAKSISQANKTAGEVIQNAVTSIQVAHQEIQAGRESPERVFYRVDYVDNFIKVKRKTLHAYVGKTGMGKTALEIQCFVAQIFAGRPVVLGCTESPAEEIVTRMLAYVAGVPFWEAVEPSSNAIVGKLYNASKRLAQFKDNFIVWGEDDFQSDIDKFCYLVTSAWRKWNALDMWWFDHFADAEMPESKDTSDKFAGVRQVMRSFKRLAIKTNSAGTILTQYNKDADDIPNPGLKYITGSSHFVRPCQLITALSNPDSKPGQDQKEIERVKWYALKGRFTGRGAINLSFNGAQGKFYRELNSSESFGDNGSYGHRYGKDDERENI